MARGNKIGITAELDDRVSSKLDKVRDNFDRLGKSPGAKSVLQGVGIGAGISAYNLLGSAVSTVTGFLEDSVVKAREEAAGIAVLDASLRANIDGWNGNRDAIEAVIASREKLAFNDDDQRAGLALLVASTHDVTKALELQGVAMDLSRLRGTDLIETSTLISKVYQGNLSSLKRFGIALGDVKTGTEAIAKIQKLAAGQAEAYGKSGQGEMESFAIAVGDLQEDIGNLVTGPMTDFVKVAADDVRSVQGLVQAAKDLGKHVEDTGIKFPEAGIKIDVFGNLIDFIAKGPFDGFNQIAERNRKAMEGVATGFDRGASSANEWGGEVDKADDATKAAIHSTRDLRKEAENAATAYDDWVTAMHDATDALNNQKRGHAETSVKIKGVKLDLREARGELQKLSDVNHPTLKQQIDMNDLKLKILEDQDQLAVLKTDLQTAGKVRADVTINAINNIGRATDGTDAKVNNLIRDLARLGVPVTSGGGNTPGHPGGGGAATGGYRPPGWTGRIGEEGEEGMTLLPGGGALITPHSGGGSGGTTVHTHIFLDGRVIADVVDRYGALEAGRAPQSPYAG